MRRSLLVVVVAAFALSISAQPALAGGPSREPVPPFHDLFEAGEVCPFPVAVDSTRQKEIVKTFSDERFFITGASVERITNVTTGKSIVVNASGPIHFRIAGGILTARAEGRTLFSFFPSDLGPGSAPALLLTTGLAIYVLDLETGAITFTHRGGTTQNICQTLA